MKKVTKDQFINDMKATFGTKYDYQQLSDYYDLLNPPTRATKGSAGYDFESPISFELKPGETIKIPTGIRALIDENWVLKIYSRSSLGFKYRLWLDNLTGIIDSDYSNSDNEGHMFVKLTNDSNEDKSLSLKAGQGMVQGIIKGKVSLLKELLRQKWELTERDEKELDNLNEEEVNQIVQVLNRINTPKDLHDQLKKLSDSKRQAENHAQFAFSQD